MMRGASLEKHQKPMREIVRRLEAEFALSLSEVVALELFAREGDWQTVSYAPYVKTLEAWEINPQFYEGLKRNLPNAKIKITDTWKEIRTTPQKYDFIVADTPQGIYGENGEHCNHFGLLPDIFRIANDGCVIVLNVNVEPYNFREDSGWWKRRKEYYKTEHPERLNLTEVVQHYEGICRENDVRLEWSFFQQRYVDFLCYFVMRIQKQRS